MKALLIALTLCFICSCAQAKTQTELIVGKWRPVEKTEAIFTWEFQKDGTLIVVGDNGKLMAYRWQLEEPDILTIIGSPNDVTREKIILSEGKLSMKDSAGKWHEMILAKS